MAGKGVMGMAVMGGSERCVIKDARVREVYQWSLKEGRGGDHRGEMGDR